MFIRRSLIIFTFLLSISSSYGQAPFYFTGYGRALIENNQFTKGSEIIQGRPDVTKKSLGGNFVFDLGMNVKPNENFKANAILRVNNQFGGFFGAGSVLEFRQVQIQGVLAKKVLYNIGDIDLGLTKYTLFNPYESLYSPFEAQGFKIRRDLVSYDNFNYGNKWRLQGIQAGTAIGFKKGIEEIQLNGFATRIIPSNYLTTPDRLLYGGSVKVKQSRYAEIGGNIVGVSDVKGTSQDTISFYNNNVISGEYKLAYTFNAINLSLFGEVGRSFYYMKDYVASQSVNTYDGFFDVGAGLKHRYIPVQVAVSYRLVGPDFTSPGAQTRRIFDFKSPSVLNVDNSRAQTVYDRLSDLNLYNRSITTTLMAFNPAYNNATPYGAATPNRKGVTIDANYGNADSLVYASVNTQILSEVLGVGLPEKRQFSLIQAGITLNVNKLLNRNRLLAISSSIRHEQTQGAQSLGINLNSSLLDAALTVETLKKLDFIGGLKHFKANGKEMLMIRNDFNQIINYTPFNTNDKQNIYTAGIRYRFSNYIFFAANAFITNNASKADASDSYQINQFFFSYIMRF